MLVEDSGRNSVRVSHVFIKQLMLSVVSLYVVLPGMLLAAERSIFSDITSGETDLAFQQPRTPFYGELHFGAAGIRNSDLDFVPLYASVTAGLFAIPNIGIELFADTSLADDGNSGFKLELSSAVGIATRLQSPPRSGLSGYVVLGLVDYTLTQTPLSSTSSSGAIKRSFTGGRFSVGVIQQLRRIPQLSVSAEYRVYYADQPLRVDSVVLGLRFMP